MDSSNFWKLDKIDKIGIALIFIVFALYSTFSCFASESESVDVTLVEGLYISPSKNAILYGSSSIGYITIEPGYVYTFNNTSASSSKVCCFANETPYYNQPVESFSISSGDTFTFTYSEYNFLYFDISYGTSGFELTRVPLEGMSGAVDNLSYYAGFNLWESFSNTIVYALPITITCFGIYVVCGFVQKFSKGA